VFSASLSPFTFLLFPSVFYSPPVNLVIAAHDARDRFRVDAVFFQEYARRQGLDRVVVFDGHDPLLDDWPTVQCLVNEVDGASSPFDAVIESLSLCVQSRKGRQKARVNIESAPAKRL
jgi:hypothetical protein